MKAEFVETYSLKELARKGYKERQSGAGLYLGDSKWPTSQIDSGLFHLLGKKMKVVNMKGDQVEVEQAGEAYFLPSKIIKKYPPKRRKSKMIVAEDKVAVFNGYGFEFPCRLSNCSKAEARKIALWVLRVSR